MLALTLKDGSKPSVLHVVVGAGIIPYFRNAIESILRNTSDQVLAIYNWISPEDSENFEVFLKNAEFGSRVTFQTLANEGLSKTGSLYDAYNFAIDFATQANYDYLNLVQADCQLMWWSDEIPDRLRDVFSRVELHRGLSALCVGTDFPVFGKFVGLDFRDELVLDPILGTFVDNRVGMGDVAIYSMSAVQSAGFRFVGTEAELQERLWRDGFRVPVLDVPCVAFLPWPASVRNGSVVGKVFGPYSNGTPMLGLVEEFHSVAARLTWDSEPFWMEDWVKPLGWDCLYPYWPTSIENPKWLRRRLKACKQLGVKPWARASQIFGEGAKAPFGWSAVPRIGEIALALGWGYLRQLVAYQRRLLHALVKRIRALL